MGRRVGNSESIDNAAVWVDTTSCVILFFLVLSVDGRFKDSPRKVYSRIIIN